jgi:hypothetical protein
MNGRDSEDERVRKSGAPGTTPKGLLEVRVSLLLSAALFIPAGVVFLVISLATERLGSTLYGTLVIAPSVAVVGGWFTVRDGRKRVERATTANVWARRSHRSHALRFAMWAVIVESVDVLLASAYHEWFDSGGVMQGFAFVGAMQVGFGVAFLVLARWVDRWERTHRQQIVYEERFTFRGRSYHLI